MITGVIKNKVDKIWTDIWAGDITNPLTVIEQLTYLMFIRSLDEKELETEEFEHMTGEKMEKIFPQSTVGQSMRWSKFKNNDPRDIFNVISQRVFPAIKNMKHGRLPDFTEQGELVEIADDSSSDVQNETAFARYMSDAMFLIPTPQVLQKIITGLDDLYEHDIADLDMEFPKQIKDTVYRLLQEPTLDHFREFLQDQTGEHNAIDFKQEWIEKDKLAKLMLALANYGGGIVVFGVHENDDKTFSCDGLKELQAKEQIGAWIKPYLSSSLKYDVYDFSYQTSEYEALKGKQFQMLFVEDTPQFLPFISRKEGSNIKPATIYIRRGTSDEQVTEEELSYILERRMKHIFPVTGKPLVLEEHLEQLKILYNHIEPTISKIKNPENIPFVQALKTFHQTALPGAPHRFSLHFRHTGRT